MKRSVLEKESKSLKTFYLYAAFVIFLIFAALVIKLVSIFLHSSFDGSHHFTIAITKNNAVKQIIAFSPQVPSIASLIIKDTKPITYMSLRTEFGISPDAQIAVPEAFVVPDEVDAILWHTMLSFPTVQTNATIVDITRLVILARGTVSNNRIVRDITLSDNSAENNTIIARVMNDPIISSEGVSIQIINASNVSGLGQQLGRVLTNMGANVVDVTTSQTSRRQSAIQYFGAETYTLKEAESLTHYPISKLSRETIANIVITIGEDTGKRGKF